MLDLKALLVGPLLAISLHYCKLCVNDAGLKASRCVMYLVIGADIISGP